MPPSPSSLPVHNLNKIILILPCHISRPPQSAIHPLHIPSLCCHACITSQTLSLPSPYHIPNLMHVSKSSFPLLKLISAVLLSMPSLGIKLRVKTIH